MRSIFQCDPRGGHNRYKCNFDFFKKWTNEMAYVLGFLYADGCIVDAVSSRTQYIQFTSKDKDTLILIKSLLKSTHPLSSRPRRKRLHRNGVYESSEVFNLRIGSRKMFNDLMGIGVVPNKSKIVSFPLVSPRYLSHFIRGYFDGDGCVYLQLARGKTQKTIIKKLSVIFTSGSKIFLEGLSSNIRKIVNLKQEKVYDSHFAYQLRYSTSDSIELFKFFYQDIYQNIYMERKFKIFLRYFLLRPLKIDKDIKNILENLNYGHVAKKQTLRSAKPLYVGANPTVASKMTPGWRNGSRTTLKMLRAKAHVGSTPTPGTTKNYPSKVGWHLNQKLFV